MAGAAPPPDKQEITLPASGSDELDSPTDRFGAAIAPDRFTIC
jgi:hypothetical protein